MNLKACPFCGGEASHGTIKYDPKSSVVRLNKQDVFHFINCVICGANNKGLIGYATQDQALAHWNERRAIAEERAELLSGDDHRERVAP